MKNRYTIDLVFIKLGSMLIINIAKSNQASYYDLKPLYVLLTY